mmetsp:Transcript_14686/g.35848  ORF Transcript_14686/g.35848 Transcript_14686/m.35848 type:complete len:123 (+) Transcript_14686:869-1237(+)
MQRNLSRMHAEVGKLHRVLKYLSFERYILSMMIADEDGSLWVTAFNDEAEQILGRPAGELQQYIMVGDEESFNKVLQAPNLREFILFLDAEPNWIHSRRNKELESLSIASNRWIHLRRANYS